MTREQIEQAALQCAKDRWGNSESQHAMAKAQGTVYGFKQGAQWRINSVWHDVSEEPKEHKLVLIEDDFCGEPDYGVWQAPFPKWKDSIVHFSSKRWAYLDDLLPERKEEAKNYGL